MFKKLLYRLFLLLYLVVGINSRVAAQDKCVVTKISVIANENLFNQNFAVEGSLDAQNWTPISFTSRKEGVAMLDIKSPTLYRYLKFNTNSLLLANNVTLFDKDVSLPFEIIKQERNELVISLNCTSNISSDLKSQAISYVTTPKRPINNAVAVDKNFVLERTYKQKSYNEYTPSINVANIRVSYSDILNRLTQVHEVQYSPTGKDLVQHYEYDAMGRISTDYLPFINTNGNSKGQFLANPSEMLNNFYSAANSDISIPRDEQPWQEISFEKAPEGRVTTSNTFGKNYKNFPSFYDYKFNKNNDATLSARERITDEPDVIRFGYYGDYTSNDLTNLRKVKILGKHGAYALEVSEISSKDLDNAGNNIYRIVKQYTDFEGRIILQRTLSDGNWIDIYYVYDELNQIRAVISPKLSDLLNQSYAVGKDLAVGNDLNNLNELAHLYMYDEYGRMIVKKEPGIGEKFYIFDKYDRLAFYQDINQRSRNAWSYLQYDALNRPVVYGEAIITGGGSSNGLLSTRAQCHDGLNAQNANFTKFTTKSNNEYSSINTSINGLSITYDPLILTFFDDYTFTLPSGASAPEGAALYPRGFQTGRAEKVLGQNTWLRSVVYYNSDLNPIKTFKDIYGIPPSGAMALETASSVYDPNFFSRVISTTLQHTLLSNSLSPIIVDKFCYDHQGRLKKVINKISKGTADKDAKEVVVASYQYNELGAVNSLKQHQTALMKSPAISIAYKYHLHGMPTEISSDLFEQKLFFDTRSNGTGGYYNGNIAELLHRFEKQTDGDTRGQAYSYDKLNRFKKNSNITTSGVGYKKWNNIEELTYDVNGNIRTLQRQNDSGIIIDNLAYIYKTNGNIIESITDLTGRTEGFKNEGDNKYSFDSNGNLLKDANRGISNISYNFLNLPTDITLPVKNSNTSNKVLHYTYSASGNKLTSWADESTVKTYYTGRIEYDYQALPIKIFTTSGFVQKDVEGNWQYYYAMQDYQGNTRLLAYYDPNTKKVIASQKSDYYTFGWPIRYDSNGFNRYLYQGMEQQPFTEFIDFGWRQYDPLIGRWFNNDPADQFLHISPYAYSRNNPLMYVDPDGAIVSLASIFKKVSQIGPDIIQFLKGNCYYELTKGAQIQLTSELLIGGGMVDLAMNVPSMMDNAIGPGQGGALSFKQVPNSTKKVASPTEFTKKISNTTKEPRNYPNGRKLLLDVLAILTFVSDVKMPSYNTFSFLIMPANSTVPVSADGTPAGNMPPRSIKMNLSDHEYTEFYELVRRINAKEELTYQERRRYLLLYEKAQSKFYDLNLAHELSERVRNRLEYDYDCSDLARMLHNINPRGYILEITPVKGKWLKGYEYGTVTDFQYHAVYIYGKFVYDPMFSDKPILTTEFLQIYRKLNPNGIKLLKIIP